MMNLMAFLLSRLSFPSQTHICDAPVYLESVHHRNLGAALVKVILIDTESIDPDHAWLRLKPQILQGQAKGLGDPFLAFAFCSMS